MQEKALHDLEDAAFAYFDSDRDPDLRKQVDAAIKTAEKYYTKLVVSTVVMRIWAAVKERPFIIIDDKTREQILD